MTTLEKLILSLLVVIVVCTACCIGTLYFLVVAGEKRSDEISLCIHEQQTAIAYDSNTPYINCFE